MINLEKVKGTLNLLSGYYVKGPEVDLFFDNDVYLKELWDPITIENRSRYLRMAENFIDKQTYIGEATQLKHAFPRNFNNTCYKNDLPSFTIPQDIKEAVLLIVGLLVEGVGAEQVKQLDKNIGVSGISVAVVNIAKETGKITDNEWELLYMVNKYRQSRTAFV